MSDVKTTTAAIYQAVLDSLNNKGECGVLPPAPPGKSAYEVAVANGFKGSEKQWLDSLTIKQENEIARLEARIADNEKITKDSKYAASKLVGEEGGNVMQVGAFGIGRARGVNITDPTGYFTATGATGTGFRVTTPAASLITPSLTGSTVNAANTYYASVITNMQFSDSSVGDAMHRIIFRKHNIDLQYVVRKSGGAISDLEWSPGVCVYTGGNTKKDSNTNLLLRIEDTIPNNSAASRLVGMQKGQIAPVEDVVAAFGLPIGVKKTGGKTLNLPMGDCSLLRAVDINQGENVPATGAWIHVLTTSLNEIGTVGKQMAYSVSNTDTFTRISDPTGSFVNSKWDKFYTSGNTTRDTATGFLKASSPVLHVYNDSITKIHEAEQLDITVDKKGVGHYEIHGTTGLRKDDGWFMSPPRDVHGNVLCMVDLEEKDGVIILKTYKKLFDFETVSIVHDYDNPMDIPEGVCVEFRFNDLPEEPIEELEPEEEPIVDEVEEPEVVEEEDPVEELKED